MAYIDIENLTKDYGNNRGVFDISIKVKKGECYGFLGPNGAGKTTTIRHLMGFSKPDSGKTMILGLESFNNSAVIKNSVGYLPGEIELPNNMTGKKFLDMMAKMRHLKNDNYLKMLTEKFELDSDISIKKMSLGTKRKLAIVNAFMHDPDILILDEPTSGLDPVMQQIFIDYILEEKERGKTIFLSSHIFNEVDKTCDKIAIIKDGQIIDEFIAEELKDKRDSIYDLYFYNLDSMRQFEKKGYRISSINDTQKLIEVYIGNDELNSFIEDLTKYKIKDFNEVPFSLEDYFMQFYENDNVFEEVK